MNAHGALEEQLATENPWPESKPYPRTTVSHRSHKQCSRIKPGPMGWDATSTFTRPRPNPTLTTFTFSAIYINGSTVKCDKIEIKYDSKYPKSGASWSYCSDIGLEGLKKKKFVAGSDNIPKHVSKQRKYMVLQRASSACSQLASTINEGLKNANLAHLKKIAPALNCVNTGKPQKFDQAFGPRYTDTTPCIQESTPNYDRERSYFRSS
jgi:hypothetical protein